MALRDIVIRYRADWTETISVDIPTGLTQRELDEAIDAAIKDRTPDGPDDSDIDCKSADVWGGYECAPPDLTLQTPDADCWVDWEGARWVTDRMVLIREGSPMPAEMGEEYGGIRPWRKGTTVAEIERAIAGQQSDRPCDGVFHRRLAPVLSGARVCSADRLAPAFVYRDDALVAIVMPLRWASDDAINADGSPACPGAA